MGFRKLKVTYIATLKLIRRFFNKPGSLSVKWVQKYLVKEGSSSEVKSSVHGPWNWRKLLKSPIAQNCIQSEIQEGEAVRFWLDNWHPLGRLIDTTMEKGMLKLGIRRSVRVCDVAVGNESRLHDTQNRILNGMIHQIRTFTISLDQGDKYEMLRRHGQKDYQPKLSSSNTLNKTRISKEPKDWSNFF